MDRAKELLAVLLLSMSLADAASAAVQFNPGERVSVARAPRSAVAGPITRNDSNDDLAVSVTRSDEVNVLLAEAGVLRIGKAVKGFNAPMQIGLAQVNLEDSFNDLIVVDKSNRLAGLWISLGNGDGTFQMPYLIPGDRLTMSDPQKFVTADFDGDGDTDIAVSDAKSGKYPDRVVVLLNDGANPPGFAPGPSIIVGSRPDDIAAADFDGDEDVDLAVLNRGGPLGKDITLILNKGVVEGVLAFEAEPNFSLTGDRPYSMLAADLNADGLPDLAMLNTPANALSSEVAVLWNLGDNNFQLPDRIPVPCPAPAADLTCKSMLLVAADWDEDGSMDFGVEIQLSYKDSNRTEPDKFTVIRGTYLEGQSGGRFIAPRNYWDTDKAVKGLSVGDFNADGRPDVAIAAAQNSSALPSPAVRLYLNASTPPAPTGDQCSNADECATEVCDSGYCCEEVCPQGYSCAVPGFEGECREIKPNGGSCHNNKECQSNICTDYFNGVGVCCGGRCGENERCDIAGHEGTCWPLGEPGDSCGDPSTSGSPQDDFECRRLPGNDRGYCVDNVCCRVDHCESGYACSAPDGLCQPMPTPSPTPLGPGDECSPEEDLCQAGTACINHHCCKELQGCPSGFYCGSTGECVEGSAPATRTRTPTEIPSWTPTPTPTMIPTASHTPTVTWTPRATDTPQPSPAVTIHVSSDSGCTIGAAPAAGTLAPLWIPALLWLGRRRSRN